MIISASYKTDIPAFYGSWLMNRLNAGYCRTINPYGGQIYTIDLRPEAVDGIVFWTRNIGPLLPHLDAIRERGYAFMVQHTITGYPRALEERVIPASRAVAHMRTLAARYGPRVAVWRYDPILVTSLTPLEWHKHQFTRLAVALEGTSDEVVISFAQLYRKTRRNLAEAAREHHFTWDAHATVCGEAEGTGDRPSAPDPRALGLVRTLAEIAQEHGMRLSICSQEHFQLRGVAEGARCIDAARLSAVAGREISAAPQKHNRAQCLCAASKDIGEYDTCPHGCVYCYAVRDRLRALERYQAHDPASEFLFPPAHAAARRNAPPYAEVNSPIQAPLRHP